MMYKRIGDYIELVDERNVDLEIDLLLGLSISKQFIPSVANTVGTNMKNYKIIRKGQFACSTMQVRRDGKMPIALLDEFDKAIISQAYPVFRVIVESKLLPEYLMMWFSRSEFDRLATFHAVGGVRGSLEWEDFLDFELPIPSIEKQQEIVNDYNTIVNRIALNQQLNQKLEETAQALYKHWFIDFEFPNEEGKPYKSSGGAMVYNEELDKEIPEGWLIENCGDHAIITAGGDKPKLFSQIQTNKYPVPIFSNSTFNQGLFGFTDKAKILDKSITISARGGIGYTALRTERYVPIVRLIVVIPHKTELLNYLYHFLNKYPYNDISSAQAQLTIPDVSIFKMLMPPNILLTDFQRLSTDIYRMMEFNRNQDEYLLEFKNVLLSKMTKVVIEEEII